MNLAVGAALVAALIAWPPTAQAAAPTPEVAHYLDLARMQWGAQPACPAGIDVIPDALPEGMPATTTAAATMPGCTIWLSPAWRQLEPATRCAVVVHEYGHTLGHDHVADEANIMAPDAPTTAAPACVAEHPPPPPAHVRARRAAWPKWARSSAKVSELYFEGRVNAARREYRRLQKHQH